MTIMSVWQALKPLLILIAAGAVVLTAVIYRRGRHDEKNGTLPNDTLAGMFNDAEDT